MHHSGWQSCSDKVIKAIDYYISKYPDTLTTKMSKIMNVSHMIAQCFVKQTTPETIHNKLLPCFNSGVHKLLHLRAVCISLLLCTGSHVLLRHMLHNMISNKTFCKILIVLFNLNILHKKLIQSTLSNFPLFNLPPCLI